MALNVSSNAEMREKTREQRVVKSHNSPTVRRISRLFSPVNQLHTTDQPHLPKVAQSLTNYPVDVENAI